ncbi:MAG: arginine--tRNA ligase, partial [Bacteroidaceae bacterium]|nr:arginine--tRNA ligase [Bacteroidaceae bacterium]
QGIMVPETLPLDIEITTKEEEIVRHISDFKQVITDAAACYSPAGIANYCYDLVKEYNQFYHDFPVLREENEGKRMFRLVLSAQVAKVVRLGMALLGIEMPERM